MTSPPGGPDPRSLTDVGPVADHAAPPAQGEGRSLAQLGPIASQPLEPDEAPAVRGGIAALRRSTWWWARSAAIVVTLFVGYQLVLVAGGWIHTVLTTALYLVFGGILALVLTPAVAALERHVRVPRTAAILLCLALFIGGLALLIWATAGAVATEARQLADQVPHLVERLQHWLDDVRSQLNARGVRVGAVGLPSDLPSRLQSVLLSGVTGTLTAVVDVIVTLVVAFWLLKDGNQLRSGLLSYLPSRARGHVDFGLEAVRVVIGGYVRGQLFMSLLIGVMAGVGCALLGVPFPLVVGLAAGVFELIPIVGPFVGGAVAMLLALTVSPLLMVFTIGLFLVIHVIEGYILAPRIQARFVRLHPLVALLALFAGIDAAGFLGALFAVPAASLVAVFARTAIGDWRANRPDLFSATRADYGSERRRRSLLGEFRLFKRSPVRRDAFGTTEAAPVDRPAPGARGGD